MSGILVPFLKQIVGNFVFKTKVLDGLPLRHCLRFVTDEQMLKIAAAIPVSYTHLALPTILRV